jgi:hypothetical protein
MKSQQEQQRLLTTGESGGGLSPEEAERFETFAAETQNYILTSIIKTTLDTVQSAWLHPLIQLKVEKFVSSIGSKLVQKYSTSLLPEGARNLRDQSFTSSPSDEIPLEDQWIDEMDKGKSAGPIEMQNSADANGWVLEFEDETGQYSQGTQGANTVTYYPDGNPYSQKPVVKMTCTHNKDGSTQFRITMPDEEIREYVPDPMEPPGRCFFGALSKAQGDQTVDQTIHKLKNHAKGNDRVRYMNKLGVNQSYKPFNSNSRMIDGKTTLPNVPISTDVIKKKTERQQERDTKSNLEKIRTDFPGIQQEDVYNHHQSHDSEVVEEFWKISKVTREGNIYVEREHGESVDKFYEDNQEYGSPEAITRKIKNHYRLHRKHTSETLEYETTNLGRWKTKDNKYSPNHLPNQYNRGFVSNWNGPQGGNQK